MNEADTCRTYILPKLKTSGSEDETITEQLVLTPDVYLREAKFNALRELQSATGEELDALLASVLDRAFKREL